MTHHLSDRPPPQLAFAGCMVMSSVMLAVGFVLGAIVTWMVGLVF